MKGFLLLLLCMEILCASAEVTGTFSDPFQYTQNVESNVSTTNVATQSPRNATVSTTDQVTSSSSSSNPTDPTKSTSSTNDPFIDFIDMFRGACFPGLMVTGGLILACSILLLSTLLLIWKVCQLSRRLKMLGSNNDLISTNEYCVRTAKTNKKEAEPEARETSILMADFSQTQEDMANGTAKEEGGKKNEDEQMEEEKKKGVNGTASGEETSTGDIKVETPVTVAENSSPTKPQEDTTNSQFTRVEAASSSGDTEESKDVV